MPLLQSFILILKSFNVQEHDRDFDHHFRIALIKALFYLPVTDPLQDVGSQFRGLAQNVIIRLVDHYDTGTPQQLQFTVGPQRFEFCQISLQEANTALE